MICRVCQNPKASSHSYYGATSICPSCRGFFMRSVQSQIYKAFQKCPPISNCVIESKSRKSCKSCRFQKCLSVGMKTSYVMTHEEKLKVLMEANTKLHKPLELIFQDHSKQEILKLWNEFLFSASSGAYENYVNNMQHAVRHLDFFTSYTSLENDQFDQFLDLEYMKRYAIEFFKINGQVSHDAEKLFKHNYNRMNTFYYAVFCYGVSS